MRINSFLSRVASGNASDGGSIQTYFERNGKLQGLVVVLKGSVKLSTAAKVDIGDPASRPYRFIRQIDLRLNGQDTIFSSSGMGLYVRNLVNGLKARVGRGRHYLDGSTALPVTKTQIETSFFIPLVQRNQMSPMKWALGLWPGDRVNVNIQLENIASVLKSTASLDGSWTYELYGNLLVDEGDDATAPGDAHAFS